MQITYANTVDEDSKWIELAAATRNVLAYLLQKRETATDAAEHGETSVAVIPPAGGQAAELENE